MNVDPAAFESFRESLAGLAAHAPADELGDEDRMARARQAFAGRLDRRLAVDLETCIHCGMCAEACHFFVATEDPRYTPAYKVEPLRRFYRREMSPLRLIYRPFTKRVGADDLRAWRELVYDACTGCGRCDMMCPMGINISSAINVMREGIAAAGLAPGELAALAAGQRDDNAFLGVDAAELRTLVATFGNDVRLDRERADVLLLTTAVEVRLFPESIRAAARILDRSGADWTLSGAAFEASSAGLISGDAAARKVAVSRIVDAAKACGAGTVIVPESGHAYQALRWEGANDLGAPLPFEVLALAEFVARELAAGRLALKKPDGVGSATYHDPCRMGRHGGVYEQPRDVLKAMGLEVRDTEANRRENLCCGGGCGEYAIGRSAALRQRAFDLKRHELDAAGADAVVTGCVNCRVNLMIGAANSGWDTPVLSLAETVAANLAE